MPLRSLNRQQTWLLPPTLDELIPDDHPARFVAMFVDNLDEAEWRKLGIGLDGELLGAPAYHPRVLLGVWLYGFMTSIRSSRKLEAACRDQMPYLWLTGWQHPDHNTLWRFYKEHRIEMRHLLQANSPDRSKHGLGGYGGASYRRHKTASECSERSYL
jgi:transposase